MARRCPLLLALTLTAAVVIPRAYLLSRAHNESSDDDYHLVRGLEFLRRDKGLVHRELNDPPLGQAIAALPLWLLGGTTHGPDEGTALYNQKNYSPQTATTIIALWKATLFLPIAAVIFQWCLRLYGPTSAWLALTLVLFDPTIAAHLHLASLDVIATGAILFACYAGWQCFDRPSRRRILIASIATAAALLIKHTAVLVPGIVIVYAAIGVRGWRPANSPGGIHPLRLLATGALLTVCFVWALLLFDISPVHLRLAGIEMENVAQPRHLPAGIYIKSVLDAARHADEPNDAYLFGQVRRGGWWYYFPVVASYKVPIVTGALWVIALFSPLWRRPTRAELSLAVPALLYIVFLLTQPIQIGWRHALPAYVPLLMLTSRVVAPGRPIFQDHPHSRPIRTWEYWCFAGVVVFTTSIYHPDYIRYLNRPVPRPYEILSDSNLDWGQSLKPAARWIDANKDLINTRPVYIRAFAAANRAVRHYLGERATRLRFGDRPPATGLLIISPVCLSGVSESADEYAFLRGVPPHHKIGKALYVYDLDALVGRK